MRYKKRNLEPHNRERIKYIANFFRDIRKWQGESRDYLSEKYSISRSLIELAESQNMNITLKTLFYLCDVYQIKPKDLFSNLE